MGAPTFSRLHCPLQVLATSSMATHPAKRAGTGYCNPPRHHAPNPGTGGMPKGSIALNSRGMATMRKLHGARNAAHAAANGRRGK